MSRTVHVSQQLWTFCSKSLHDKQTFSQNSPSRHEGLEPFAISVHETEISRFPALLCSFWCHSAVVTNFQNPHFLHILLNYQYSSIQHNIISVQIYCHIWFCLCVYEAQLIIVPDVGKHETWNVFLCCWNLERVQKVARHIFSKF